MPVDPQMQGVLERTAKAALPPFHTLDAGAARRLYKESRAVLSPPVPEVGEVRDLAASGPAGRYPCACTAAWARAPGRRCWSISTAAAGP